jgi:MFS family permease
MRGDHQVDAAGRRHLSAAEAPPNARSVWSSPYRPLTIGVVALITLLAFEAIGTATAMPVVARDLDALGDYTWAFNAFLVASLLGMVAGGLWSDALGPRPPLVWGVMALAAGSVVAGAAPTLAVLAGGRGLQGIGAGLVIVSVYVLIARAYDESVRPKAFSVLAAAWIVPSLVGPLVAGWLADSVTWRAVFWLVPIFVLPPAFLLFPRLRAYDGGTPHASGRARLLAGAATAAGLLALQHGLLQLSLVGLLEGAVGLAVVIAAVRFVLPTGALRFRRGLPASVMMRGLVAAAFFSAEVFVPLALVETRGVSVTYAGMVLATAAAMWSIGSYAQSRLPGDRDRSRAVRVGASIVGCSVLTLPLALVPAIPPWTAAVSWAVGALGMGLAMPSVSVQVVRLSPATQLGINSSALQIVDSVMNVIVISFLGLGYAWAVASGGATGTTFAALWLGSATMALIAVLVAGRMRPLPGAEPGSAV